MQGSDWPLIRKILAIAEESDGFRSTIKGVWLEQIRYGVAGLGALTQMKTLLQVESGFAPLRIHSPIH